MSRKRNLSPEPQGTGAAGTVSLGAGASTEPSHRHGGFGVSRTWTRPALSLWTAAAVLAHADGQGERAVGTPAWAWTGLSNQAVGGGGREEF